MNVSDYYPSDHGFPPEAFVVNPPPKNLECHICFQTLNNPRQCRNADKPHAFCLSCITAWLQRTPSCPECRGALTVGELIPSAKIEFVEELEAHCCAGTLSHGIVEVKSRK